MASSGQLIRSQHFEIVHDGGHIPLRLQHYHPVQPMSGLFSLAWLLLASAAWRRKQWFLLTAFTAAAMAGVVLALCGTSTSVQVLTYIDACTSCYALCQAA